MNQGKYHQIAQANAKLALMMALGELQQYAGQDQRVTAEADILDSDGFLGKDRDPSAKHYVGVYSTEEWQKREKNGIRSSLLPYKSDRNKDAFRRWLVSGDPSDKNDINFATQSPTDPRRMVEMVGVGSVGTTNSEDRVSVPYEDINDESGKTTGRLAYWVSDQGVKARVNIADNRRDTSKPEWSTRIDRTNPVQMGVDSIDGFESLVIDSTDELQQQEFEKVLSYGQVGLLQQKAVSSDDLKARYHDATTYSRGVLSDAARGGLKRDLSLPFELPELEASGEYSLNQSDVAAVRDSDYTSMWEFSNSGDQRSEWVSAYWPGSYKPNWWSNKLGYIFSYPGDGGTDSLGMRNYLRGPTWKMLRNHYRLYKREYEKLSLDDPSRQKVRNPSTSRTWLAQPYLPYSHRADTQGHAPLTRTYAGELAPSPEGQEAFGQSLSSGPLNPFFRFGNSTARHWGTMGHESLGLTPISTRLTLVLGTYGADTNNTGEIDQMFFTLDAVGTIWNPYNVAIETEAIFSDVNLEGLKMNAQIEGAWSVDLPFKRLRVGVTEESDPAYPFASLAPSKLIRLEPGEVRTYSLNYPAPQNYTLRSTVPGSFVNNNWTGGLSGKYSGRRVAAGQQVKFTFMPIAEKVLNMDNYLGFFHDMRSGEFRNPFEFGTKFHDLPQTSGVHIFDADSTDGGSSGKIEKSVTIPKGANSRQALLTIDFKLRASDDVVGGIARDFDPRSIVNHGKVFDSSSAVPSNWDFSITSISDYDEVQLGVGAGGDRNNGFWGSSHEGDGQTHIVYFEVPDAPLASLASFQHLQTGAAAQDQPYAIGGSYVPKSLNPSEVLKQNATGGGHKNATYDMSYLSNDGLWDRYYFTGLTLDGANIDENNSLQAAEMVMKQFIDPKQENPLANRRLSLAPDSTEPAIEEMTHYRWIARHMMLDGAFNVNSTRVEAWKAWLGSLKGKEIDTVNPVTGEVSPSSVVATAASRSAVTAGGADAEWLGYASLSDSQINTLAEKVVEQVKRRGPFLSVADFVNRRLTNGPTGGEGALQAALRAASLDIGSGVEEGIPGTIRQGDILAGLGSSITARSDTFVVRAYGEALNSNGFKVEARAWCEAVIQRIPAPVDDNGQLLVIANPDFPNGDPSRTDDYILNPDASVGAKLYGREFRVISFRWLSKEEI